MLATVPIELIYKGSRLRSISEAQVEALSNSIGDVGLLNPITVYPRPVKSGNVNVDGFGLVAGAHRLEACKRLGLVEIAAQVVELTDLERQIAECDENLCGTHLTASERALFTRRRKEAYEALHPATKHGGDRRSTKSQTLRLETEVENFTADTAAKTGQSERKVQLDAERGAKVGTAALALLKGTALDTGKYLDELKSLPAAEQAKKVREDLEARKSGGRVRSKPAPEPLNDDDAHEKQVAALMAAWNKASKEAREDFLSRIDTPVFDRSAA